MSGDRKAEQDALHRARQLHRELSDKVDEHFKQSMDGLSRGLGERMARRSADDPKNIAEKRYAALAEYDLERARRLKSMFVLTAGGALSACIAWAVVMLASPFDDPPMSVAANAKRAGSVEVAVAAAPPPPAAMPPIQIVPAGPVPLPAPMQASAPPVVEQPVPLTREEVREMQTKLRGFGFNPGPVDGAAGPMTAAAAVRYRENRGLGPADTLDRDLLEDLRADPAPQVVVAQAPPAARPHRPPRQALRGDGFDGLRTAMGDLERWFQSIGR
jgi:hypothetical protein